LNSDLDLGANEIECGCIGVRRTRAYGEEKGVKTDQ
jgi:hypothetical protein